MCEDADDGGRFVGVAVTGVCGIEGMENEVLGDEVT